MTSKMVAFENFEVEADPAFGKYMTSPTPADRVEVFMDYVRIARFDHWFKNIFVLPGIGLAMVLTDVTWPELLLPTVKVLLSVGLLASANYVINELLDARAMTEPSA